MQRPCYLLPIPNITISLVTEAARRELVIPRLLDQNGDQHGPMFPFLGDIVLNHAGLFFPFIGNLIVNHASLGLGHASLGMLSVRSPPPRVSVWFLEGEGRCWKGLFWCAGFLGRVGTRRFDFGFGFLYNFASFYDFTLFRDFTFFRNFTYLRYFTSFHNFTFHNLRDLNYYYSSAKANVRGKKGRRCTRMKIGR